jgi:hypothetical protein
MYVMTHSFVSLPYLKKKKKTGEVDRVPVYVRIKPFPDRDRAEVTYITHYAW